MRRLAVVLVGLLVLTLSSSQASADIKPVPVFDCTSIDVAEYQGLKRGFSVDYVAEGGAKADTARYWFGDGRSTFVIPRDNLAATHVYESPGEYLVRAEIYFIITTDDQMWGEWVRCEPTSITVE